MPVFLLNHDDDIFPHPSLADESGVIAIGGDLSVQRLLTAYSFGIFPWYTDEEPIMWWSPDPRAVVYPGEVKISKSMRPYMKKYQLRIDHSFEEVIRQCKLIDRKGFYESWITDDMFMAYKELHEQGYAHSFECWYDKQLIGGLYGVSLGKMFFGESMFSLKNNASKFAFIRLSQLLKEKDFLLIDCQVPNEHLYRMGCWDMERSKYFDLLRKNLSLVSKVGSWKDWGKD